GSWMNRLHTPILFLVLFWRGPKPSRPHTLFLSLRGLWMDCLHFLLLFRRSSWRTCLHFLFLSLRSARTHPLCMLCLSGSATDLHSLTEGPSGLCTDRLGSSGFRTAPLSSTMGSPGPAAGRQIIGSYVIGRLIVFSYVAGLLIACPYVVGLLIAGLAGEGHRSVRLNSGSAGDGLRTLALLLRPLPPTMVGCLFYFCFVGVWDLPFKRRSCVIPACVLSF
ncbi:hypothetical protein ILYODFUR_015710, partial [Ilyodon furcidens]